MSSHSSHLPEQPQTSLINLPTTELPLSLLQSGQFLAIKPECQGGIILQKRFYAEFVGAGAAVGGYFDVNCQKIYVIGTVEFIAPETFAERQQAFRQRISYIEQLQRITCADSPLRRASLILEQLRTWVNLPEVENIPPELIAQLVGVLPKTVNMVLQSQPDFQEELLIKSTN